MLDMWFVVGGEYQETPISLVFITERMKLTTEMGCPGKDEDEEDGWSLHGA